jgi:hypothetical protein
MLTIKIELWPMGDESTAREIGRMYIANVGGTDERGDYVAAVCRRGTTDVPRELSEAVRAPTATRAAVVTDKSADLDLERARVGLVSDYPRLAYNVWRLVIRSLRSCFPEEDRRKAGAG